MGRYCAAKDGGEPGWVTRINVSLFIRGPVSLDGRSWRNMPWRMEMIEWNAYDRRRKVRFDNPIYPVACKSSFTRLFKADK